MMRPLPERVRALLLVAGLSLGSTGCIRQMLLNGQIESTRIASGAFDGIPDYEVAQQAAAGGLVQFEGMHRLAPENEDALFLLERSWTGYAFAFMEDAMERAEDEGDRDLASFHKDRAVRAYSRAIEAGTELVALRADGFEAARAGEETLQAFLAQHFQEVEDAQSLFWLGSAWLLRTNLLKDDPEAIANIFVAVKLLEHSMKLDPAYNNRAASIQLGAYHARTAMAELEDSKTLFEGALSETDRKALMIQVTYATKYACVRADADLYKKLLGEVVTATAADDPSLRLMNTIARRKARRWLEPKRMFDACSLEAISER